MPISITEAVFRKTVRVAGGDVTKASHWYFEHPLREFDGKTASQLVEEGRAVDVLRLLDTYEAGPLG